MSNLSGPTGVICPIVTPLSDDERLDERVLRAHLRDVLPHVDGIMALGTTGELPVLEGNVADALVAVVSEVMADARAQLVLGIGGAGWAQTRRNLRRVTDAVTHVALCAPFYYSTTAPAISDYLVRVADAAPVPVVLYNIPQNTHHPLPIDVVAAMSEHENVAGIKDSGPSAKYFAQLLALRSESFTVLRGTDDEGVLDYRDAGADGFVSGLENVAPGLLRTALGATSEAERATAIQRIHSIAALAAGITGLASIKAAVALRHHGSPRLATPLPTLGEDQLHALQDRLLHLDLLRSWGD